MITRVAGLQNGIRRDFILQVRGPHLHVRRRPVADDSINGLADIGGPAIGFARRLQQAGRKRIAQQVLRCHAVDRANVRRGLREPVQSQSLVISKFHGRRIEQAETRAEYQFLRRRITQPDARCEVGVLRIVDSAGIAAAGILQRTRQCHPHLAADRIRRCRVEVG